MAKSSGQVITAYRLPDSHPYYKIRPADPDRYWMDVSTGGWANRCLPLRMANQHGWEILNPFDFQVEWKEKPALDSIKITSKNGSPPNPKSMFGFGTFTWTIPYLFVTPPNWNLVVRGPTNFWKDGAVPLDAIVETDWLPFTFTMSWKVTRPFKSITFNVDDPICLIFPVRRHDLEEFNPEIRNLDSNPDLKLKYDSWLGRRLKAASHGVHGELAIKGQGQYIRGEQVDGSLFGSHQTKLKVSEFSALEQEPALQQSSKDPDPNSSPLRGFWKRFSGK